MPEFNLRDHGALGAVLECMRCGARYRYAADSGFKSYDAFADSCFEDAADGHTCADIASLEPVPEGEAPSDATW